MKTLADLKKDAKAGNMLLKMVYHHGATENDLPDRLKGFREVVGANTIALKVRVAGSNQISELRTGPATLVEYDGKTLKVYNPGLRDCTEAEKRTLKEAEQRCKENPYSEPYWVKKAYYMKSAYPWMEGHDTVKGKKYDYSTGKVMDNTIKGDLCLAYEVMFKD